MELGSKLFSWAMGRDKLKSHLYIFINQFYVNFNIYKSILGVKFCHFLSILALEKNRRFVIFWVPFWRFWSLLVPIGIYRKTGPTKSTVLGPGPPPWDFHKFYRNFGFFWIFGPSIEPEKASVKSASTAYPPSKVKFMGNL
jgi:hypothetical protein